MSEELTVTVELTLPELHALLAVAYTYSESLRFLNYPELDAGTEKLWNVIL